MRCRRARRSLSAYLDDELAPHRRSALEDHLAGCSACAAALERARQQWAGLAAAVPAPPLPAGLWPQVATAAAAATRLPWYRRRRAGLVRAAWVAGCTALGFAAGALLSWDTPPPAAPPRPPAERALVAEAFDAATFGLDARQEGLLRCDPE